MNPMTCSKEREMDLHTDKVIHVSCQTELNLTESKKFPGFRNSRISVGSGLQGKISAQPNPARFDMKTETNYLSAGGVILSSVKLIE